MNGNYFGDLMRLSWLFTLFALSAQSATLYKVVQADGTVVYTDRPVAGAVPVALPNANTSQSLAPKQVTKPTAPSKPDVNYNISILSPAHEETIRNNQGEVKVSASIEPKAVGLFQLVLNGQVLATGASPQFVVQGVPRGEHQLEVRLVSKSGKILASSPTRVFYLHQASVLNRSG